MSDVFISYSRKNADFARRLIDKLTKVNKDSWVDWEDIDFTTNWWDEIKEGIEKADNFVFIMSQDSMESFVCNLEVDYAISLSKRIIPIIYENVEPEKAIASIAVFKPHEGLQELLEDRDQVDIVRANWKRLSHINWISFGEKDDFDKALKQLLTTIEKDLKYVKAHTRYLSRAKEWYGSDKKTNKRNRRSDLLLFGKEIDIAEAWLKQADEFAAKLVTNKKEVANPLAKDIQRKYISESRAADKQRKRLANSVRASIAILALVLIGGGIFSYVTLSGLNTQIDSANSELAVANQGGTEANNLLAEATEALVIADRQLASANTEVGQANSLLAEATEALIVADTQVSEANQQVEIASTEIGQANETVVAVQTEVDNANQQVTEASNQLATATEALVVANTQVSEANQQVEIANTEIGQANETVVAVQTEVDNANQQVEIANAQLTSVPPTLTEVNVTVVAVQAQANAVETEVANANGTATQIPPTLTQVNEQVFEANNQLATVNVDLTNVAPTLEAAETQVENALILSDGVQIAVRAQDTVQRGDQPLGLALALEASFISNVPQTNRILSEIAYAPGVRSRFSEDIYSGPITISNDGNTVASGSAQSSSVIIWDIVTGEISRTFSSDSGLITSIAFSPDDSLVAVALNSIDDAVVIWDVETGELVRQFAGHESRVNSVAFSPDGTLVLSGGGFDENGEIFLWDVETGELVRQFSGHESGVNSVTFSPDGSQILTGGGLDIYLTAASGELLLWDIETGTIIRQYEGIPAIIHSAAFSPDGTKLLVGTGSFATNDGEVILFDVDGEEMQRYPGGAGAVDSIAFSHRGTLIAAGIDRTIILWDAETGEEFLRLNGHAEFVESIAFSPYGEVLSASFDEIFLWDIFSGAELQLMFGPLQQVRAVEFSPDGTQILSASGSVIGEEPGLVLWDAETGDEIQQFGGTFVLSVAFSPDGTQALSGDFSGNLVLWDLESGQEINQLAGHATSINSIAFSPDGKLVLSASGDSTGPNGFESGELILWDVKNGVEITRFEGHTAGVNDVAFSPDGTQALSGSGDLLSYPGIGELILWDVRTGSILMQFEGHTDYINSVAFSPDGTQALSGSADNTIILWDVPSGQVIRRFTGHVEAVNSVAFSPDGRLAVSGSQDDSVIVWDIESGQIIRQFTGHYSAVTDVAFSPDGTQIVSGSADSLVILWRNDSIEQLQQWTLDNRYVPELPCQRPGSGSCNDDNTVTITVAATPTSFPIDINAPLQNPSLQLDEVYIGDTSDTLSTIGEQQYLYNGVDGEVVNVHLSSDDFDAELLIYDTDGTFITRNDDLDASTTDSSVAGIILPENGGIIIVVKSYYSNIGDGSFTLTIEESTNPHRAYLSRGNIYYRMEQYEEALADYQRAIELNPNFREAYYNAGLALRNLDRPEEAISYFESAIEIDPDYENAYAALGSTYYALEEYELMADSYLEYERITGELRPYMQERIEEYAPDYTESAGINTSTLTPEQIIESIPGIIGENGTFSDVPATILVNDDESYNYTLPGEYTNFILHTDYTIFSNDDADGCTIFFRDGGFYESSLYVDMTHIFGIEVGEIVYDSQSDDLIWNYNTVSDTVSSSANIIIIVVDDVVVLYVDNNLMGEFEIDISESGNITFEVWNDTQGDGEESRCRFSNTWIFELDESIRANDITILPSLTNTNNNDDVVTCEVTAINSANIRSEPAVSSEAAGVLQASETVTVSGQTIASDGYTWWQLDNGNWLREDTVSEAGSCSSVPFVSS